MPTPCTWQPAIPDAPSPIEPTWGPLKRYTEQCSFKTYNRVVAAAEWLFQHMLKTEGGPAACTVRALDDETVAQSPSEPLTIKLMKSYLGCQFSAWENVRMAALANDWTLIQVEYYRHTNVVAARMDRNPTRVNFIAWFIDKTRRY